MFSHGPAMLTRGWAEKKWKAINSTHKERRLSLPTTFVQPRLLAAPHTQHQNMHTCLSACEHLLALQMNGLPRTIGNGRQNQIKAGILPESSHVLSCLEKTLNKIRPLAMIRPGHETPLVGCMSC
jgi:hypothetical protein